MEYAGTSRPFFSLFANDLTFLDHSSCVNQWLDVEGGGGQLTWILVLYKCADERNTQIQSQSTTTKGKDRENGTAHSGNLGKRHTVLWWGCTLLSRVSLVQGLSEWMGKKTKSEQLCERNVNDAQMRNSTNTKMVPFALLFDRTRFLTSAVNHQTLVPKLFGLLLSWTLPWVGFYIFYILIAPHQT